MAEAVEQNKSVIVHKHVDTRTEIEYLKEHVDEIIDNREDYYKGEIIVVNDPNDPSLYVIDTEEQLRKIAGSGTGYDDYKIRELISGNTESISNLEKNKLDTNTFETTFNKYTGDTKGILDEALNDIDDLDKDIATHTTRMNQTDADIKTVKGNLTELTNNVSAITETIEILNGDATVEGSFAKVIEDTKTIINEYTINGKKISENPVLDSEDIALNDNYLPNMENTTILPGEILTTAIAKLECSLANSMLAIASALNDLDNRIGVPYIYDENGTVIQKASGLCKQIQDLEKRVSELHPVENTPTE
jgi:hypothetical protein